MSRLYSLDTVFLFSQQRLGWLLLLLSALGLELTALYFQYGMELDPCVLCIYQRVAVFGLMAAGMIGLIAPSAWIVRWLAMIAWGVAGVWGLLLAMRHAGIQFSETLDLSCSYFAEFPSWAKLDEWFPSVFLPTGFCGEIQWSFLDLSMPQWMVVLFSAYLVVLVTVLLSQLPFVRR